MRAALILNPAAGRLSQLAKPRTDLEAAIGDAGFTLLPLLDAPLDTQWDAAIAAGAEVIFIAGGDGTLRGFVKRMMQARLVYAPLPGGTMNRVCARLGLPPEPIDAIARYRPGPTMTLDVAMLNGEPLLYQSLLGRPARMLRYREMQRGEGMRGWWPLLLAALRGLFRAPWRDVVVPLGDNRRISGQAAVVTVPEPGTGAPLSLQVLRPQGPLSRLRQLWRWFHGRLSQDEDVMTLHGDRLLIHGRGRAMRVSLDGELMAMPPPLRFRLKRGALTLLRPLPA
jgi:diacylglycerol kinase family enzyme